MKIAILGYGDQGKSALEYWGKPENDITICDADETIQVPQGVSTQLGGNYLAGLDVFELIVRGPSIHPREIRVANDGHEEIFDRITSNTNEFFRVCPAPIIGITGTKGKGTTSSLITALLTAKGYKVHLGGNIGTPPLELLKEQIKPTDIVVLELANFQLIDLKYSPKTSVCLMMAPEHLNWHKDMYEYVHAKQQMFLHQTPDDLAIYNALNDYSEEVATVSPGIKLTYEVPAAEVEPQYTTGVYVDGESIKLNGDTICHSGDIHLPGRHNLENVCAAIAATWDLLEHDKHLIKNVLRSFRGLPHRLETIAEKNHITYIDDSFGTTPDTAIVAVRAFEQPKVLIVGGQTKGGDLVPLVQNIIASNVKHVVAIGDTGPKIVHLLEAYKATRAVPYTLLDHTKTMTDIVATATAQAAKGDIVLLSTGCASFDMFKNYKDRGEKFKAAVLALS